MDAARHVTVAVLGPFAVTVDGVPVRLPARLRSLLAGLATGTGGPVAVERLVDVVWGEDLPAAPRRSLRVLVRRLRVALGEAAVETVPAGYRLAVPPAQVDVAAFAALLVPVPGEGPDAERRRTARALALWRGEAFDGVGSALLRAVDAPRLTERRLAALARLADLDPAGPAPGGAPGAVPRQLPARSPGFSGRAEALAALDTLLARPPGPTARVAVLDGAGGVGKTTTALHWAHGVADRFPDGQLWASLRGFDPTGEPVPAATVVRAFLEALGVRPDRVPATPAARLALYRGIVAGRRLLVVLDDARDDEQVRPLLPGPGSSVGVVTSRASLTGLVATPGTLRVPLGTLTPRAGLDLLAARVGADRAAAEPDAARRIVERCAGLPLAIVIAAARVLSRPAFGMSATADELADDGGRLDALGDDDAAADVRAVLAASYRALSPRAARMFRLLGAHPGPDASAAAAAVLLGDGAAAARRAVGELVRVHLVAEPAHGRYAMHDLVAEYARELAHEDAPAQDAVRRVLRWYAGAAVALHRRAWPDRRVPPFVTVPAAVEPPRADPPRWFHQEWDVLLAAVGTAHAHGLDREALCLVFAVDAHYRNFGEPGRDWRQVLTTLRDAAARGHDERAEAWLTEKLASMSITEQGETPGTEALVARAIELYTRQDDALGLAFVHNEYAIALVDWGRAGQAVAHAELSLAHRRRTGRGALVANGLNILAWSLANDGDLPAALAYGEQALATARDAAAPAVEAAVQDTLGFVHAGLAEPDRAVECYRAAVAGKREHSSRPSLAASLRRLAGALAAVGRWDEARDALGESLDLHVALGLGGGTALRAELDRAADAAGAQPRRREMVRPSQTSGS